METPFSAYHIFRAYDIRGLVGEELTPRLMEKIGLALGAYMKEKNLGNTVCLGRDIRKSSKSLEKAFISGLLNSGLNIIHIGESSANFALFCGWRLGADVSAYITASHLPKQWNGVKFYTGEGVGFQEEANKRIGELVAKGNGKPTGQGNIKCVDIMADYLNFMRENFKPEKKLRVALDCGNASACLSVPKLFKELGMETIEVFCSPDPEFPNRDMDPQPENLGELCRTVVKEKADFGVAFDGDGDRGVIVDDRGRVLTPDQTGIILGKGILAEKGPGVVIANMECSMLFEKLLEPLGARISRIPVGHTFLTLEAKRQKVLLGVESSGHVVIPRHYYFDDAILIPLKIREILSKSGKRLSELADEVPVYPKKRVNFDCPDQKKFQVIKNLQNKFKKEYKELNTLDGIRINLGRGWVLIRASNTNPQIRLTAEAHTQGSLEELIEKFSEELEKEIQNI